MQPPLLSHRLQRDCRRLRSGFPRLVEIAHEAPDRAPPPAGRETAQGRRPGAGTRPPAPARKRTRPSRLPRPDQAECLPPPTASRFGGPEGPAHAIRACAALPNRPPTPYCDIAPAAPAAGGVWARPRSGRKEDAGSGCRGRDSRPGRPPPPDAARPAFRRVCPIRRAMPCSISAGSAVREEVARRRRPACARDCRSGPCRMAIVRAPGAAPGAPTQGRGRAPSACATPARRARTERRRRMQSIDAPCDAAATTPRPGHTTPIRRPTIPVMGPGGAEQTFR